MSWAEKSHILHSAIDILINLHQQGIIHGRPAIRDIAWKDGKISFMDFESHSKSHNEHWLITRDMLAFLDSLCRVKSLMNYLIIINLIARQLIGLICCLM